MLEHDVESYFTRAGIGRVARVQAQRIRTRLGQDRAVILGLSSRKLFWSHTGAPDGGIFYFLTRDNNILANRLNGCFVNHTSAAHRPEIR